MIIEVRAYARAGLLGNPSDGYYGKTISISVRNFGAHVTLYETPDLHIEPQEQDINVYKNISDLVESVDSVGYYGGDRLIKATIKKFSDNIKIYNGNIYDHQLFDNKFDLVCTLGVLIHIPDNKIDTAIKNIYKCSDKYIFVAEYHNVDNSNKNKIGIYRGKQNSCFSRNS